MRYSYVTPRVAPAIVKAREVLGDAMRGKPGAPTVEAAYQSLELLDNAARRRRILAHHIRIVTQTLGTPDLAWDRFVNLVADFRAA